VKSIRLQEHENAVLRRIFEDGEKKLHSEELHNLYSSPNIRMITSESMK
jgi:hypothetical protein